MMIVMQFATDKSLLGKHCMKHLAFKITITPVVTNAIHHACAKKGIHAICSAQ